MSYRIFQPGTVTAFILATILVSLITVAYLAAYSEETDVLQFGYVKEAPFGEQNYLYDFSNSSSSRAYLNPSSDGMPPAETPDSLRTNGEQVPNEDYSKLAALDGTDAWVTSHHLYASHFFSFNVSDHCENVTGIQIKWMGHGTNGATLFIWNAERGTWDHLTSGKHLFFDVSLDASIDEACSQFIEDGRITLAVQNDGKTFIRDVLYSDYVAVIITAQEQGYP